MLILFRYQFFFFFKCYDIGFLPFPFSDFMWYISNSNLFLLFHYFTPVFTHYFFLNLQIFFCHAACRIFESSEFLNQELNSCLPLQWGSRVFTTGSPGKSSPATFYSSSTDCSVSSFIYFNSAAAHLNHDVYKAKLKSIQNKR